MNDKPTAFIYIYGLFELNEPITRVRYVGQTINLESRLKAHRYDSDGTPKSLWVQSLRNEGKNIGMTVLDIASTQREANGKEGAWILLGKHRGWDLVNGTKHGMRFSGLDDDMAMVEESESRAAHYMTTINELVKEYSAVIDELTAENEKYRHQ